MKEKKKLVLGIGVNDADYVIAQVVTTGYTENGRRVQKQEWICPFYRCWRNMLERCYSEKYKQRKPTYEGVTCCKEWLLFSNFKRWMEQQDWEGKQLDKDIIIEGSKIYSPQTCAFVSKTTNNFVTDRGASRGNWPIGVYWSKQGKKFMAYCCNPFSKKLEYLGLFTYPDEAHEAWRKRKHQLAPLLAETETDERVKAALRIKYAEGTKHEHLPNM